MGIIFVVIGIVFVVLMIVLVKVFSFDSTVRKGFRLLKIGQYQKSKDLFEKMGKKKPQNYHILWGLASSFVGLKFYREAIKVLKRIPLSETIKHNYFSMREFYLLFAKASEGLGEYHEAIKYLMYLTKHGYDTWNINFRIADVFFKMRELKKSVHYLNIALEKNPKALPVLSRLGAIYYKIKNYTVATNYLKKVLNVDKSNLYARVYLGLLYFQTEKYHETIKFLKGVDVSKLPSDENLECDYWFYLGSAYFKINQALDSYNAFRKFLALGQSKYEGWRLALYRLAIVSEKLGKFEESVQYWDELHRIGNDLWDVQNRYSLSRLYSKSLPLRTFLFSSPENFIVFIETFVLLEYSAISNIDQISDNIFDVLALQTMDKNTQSKILIRFIRDFDPIDKSILEAFFSKMKSEGASRGVFYIVNNSLSEEIKTSLDRFPIDIKTILSFLDQIETAFEEYKKKINKT